MFHLRSTTISRVIALLLLFCSISAQGVSIELKHGMYVVVGTSCKDAPLAAMATWDGIGFGGPHESKCKTRVFHQQGKFYDLSTICYGLGDGTPTTPASYHTRVVVIGPGSYSTRPLTEALKIEASARAVAYRWCAAE